jgi:hypothetical protein
VSRQRGPTLAWHLEVGALVKETRTNLFILANKTRCNPKVSAQFIELADALPTGWLEGKLVELVGVDGEVDGIPVRDVYRGEMEEV